MAKFKVGDRVESKITVNNKHVKGAVGTVIDAMEAHVCVEFDIYIGGHAGSGRGINGHCWNINMSDLILLDSISSEPEYEVF